MLIVCFIGAFFRVSSSVDDLIDHPDDGRISALINGGFHFHRTVVVVVVCRYNTNSHSCRSSCALSKEGVRSEISLLTYHIVNTLFLRIS